MESLLRYFHLRGSNPGPLLCLTRVKLNSIISNLLNVCNIGGDYTGHSFRMGAATTAARVGIPNNMIKTLGRWSSEACRLYIRPSEDDIARVSKKNNVCNFLSGNHCPTLTDFANLAPGLYGIFLASQLSS